MSTSPCGKRGKYTFREVVKILKKDPKAQANAKAYIVQLTNPEISSFIDLLRTLFKGEVQVHPGRRLKRELFCENLQRVLDLGFPTNDDLLRALEIPPLTPARKRQLELVEQLVIPAAGMVADFVVPLLDNEDDEEHVAAREYLADFYGREPTYREVESLVHTGNILPPTSTPRATTARTAFTKPTPRDLEEIYEEEGFDDEPSAGRTPRPANRDSINELTDRLIAKAKKAGFGTDIRRVATPEQLAILGYGSREPSMVPATPLRRAESTPPRTPKAKATRVDKVLDKTNERMLKLQYKEAFEEALEAGLDQVHFVGWCCEDKVSSDKIWMLVSNEEHTQFASMWGKSGGKLSFATITKPADARGRLMEKKKDGYHVTAQSRLYKDLLKKEGFEIL